MPRFLRIALISALGLFALIGLVFTAVFFAMHFNLLNVRGSSLERNSFFVSEEQAASALIAVNPCVDAGSTTCSWTETPEWSVVEGGLQKDQTVLERVSLETGIPARLIAAVVVPEQIRFFTSEREVFKRYFEPLKILGSLSQFSLGVSGIKQETAVLIETYANDPASPRYPGDGMAALIAYAPGADHDAELYARLTDPKDHYYSYLYTALYIKEIMAEWQQAGFPLRDQPGIVGTLFNIGFSNSHPNAAPQIAGAAITTGGESYTFGALAEAFYRSDRLLTELPR